MMCRALDELWQRLQGAAQNMLAGVATKFSNLLKQLQTRSFSSTYGRVIADNGLLSRRQQQ
jgi:hypothetical protein